MREMKRLHSLLLGAGLLAGCTVGPDYQRPAVDTPQSFRFQGNEAPALANSLWWEQFGDPTLNDLIAVALRENQDVKIAASRIELFLGQYASTRALALPQVGANLGGRRQRQPEGELGQAVEPILEQYEGTLSVSWELDLFGRRRRETEAARAQVLSSEEGRRATVLTLVSSVAQTYIDLRELERQLQIARDTASSRERSYLLFKDRFEGGTVSELELAQTQSLFEASLVEIPRLEALIGQQENALSVLLGRNPGPIRAGQPLQALALPVVPSGLPSELLERRPDLRQAEQDLIAANALIGAARAQYFPTISLTGLFGYISKDFSNLFSGPSKVWSYGLAASAPIFTGADLYRRRHCRPGPAGRGPAAGGAGALPESDPGGVPGSVGRPDLPHQVARAARLPGPPGGYAAQLPGAGAAALRRGLHQLHRSARRRAHPVRGRGGLCPDPVAGVCIAGKPVQGDGGRLGPRGRAHGAADGGALAPGGNGRHEDAHERRRGG